VFDRIAAARKAVDDTYATSATVINTYKNFQSTELKEAANQASAELQALLTYLQGYDAKVKAIKDAADKAYAETVAPTTFDKDETYKAQYEAIQKELEDLTKALTDKINEFAGANVAASVKNYTDAIDASKAKVAKFSVGKDDLTTDELDDLFEDIDDLLKAINDVKDGVVESAKDAKQMIEEKMPKVADKAKEVYGEAKEFVKENAPKVADKAKEVYGEAKEKVSEVTEKIKSKKDTEA
jgi:hypothetical protein